MWEELGISGGTAIIVLTALYFIIKWAVKNGIKEAYKEISDKEKRKRKRKGAMQQQRFFRLNAVQVSHKAGRTDTGNDLQNKEHKKTNIHKKRT